MRINGGFLYQLWSFILLFSFNLHFQISFYLHTACPPSCEVKAPLLSERGLCSLRIHYGSQGHPSCGWESLDRSCCSGFPQESNRASAGIQQTGSRWTNCTKKERHLYFETKITIECVTKKKKTTLLKQKQLNVLCFKILMVSAQF